MPAELTPECETHSPSPGLPAPTDTPHAGFREAGLGVGGALSHSCGGKGSHSCSELEGDEPSPGPQYSQLMLCKIFIHSSKRLRLQVSGKRQRQDLRERDNRLTAHG